GSVVFSENFESGTLSNWITAPSCSPLQISTSQANPVSGTNTALLTVSTNKMYHDLGVEMPGYARATFWLYDDGGNQTRFYGDVRSYTGAGFNDGSVQQLFAIGCYHVGFDTDTGTLAGESADYNYYQGRVFAGDNTGWFNLYSSPVRSVGWHRFEIER